MHQNSTFSGDPLRISLGELTALFRPPPFLVSWRCS